MTTGHNHAVVLGGGLAGMLAAHVLSRHVPTVTVVERDRLPDMPQHRRGVPQGRHAHLLWSGGARIIESLLPGTTERLLAVGARRIGFQEDLVTLTALGWQHRFPATQFAILCSRPLLDWTVRNQILPNPRIALLQRTEAVELVGDDARVTGVLLRDTDGGAVQSLEADLVVDATGRGSRLNHWLAALGLPVPDEDVVDAGIAYATRIFQAPPGVTVTFPAVNIAADHRAGKPATFGVVYPIEDGRWIVTLSRTRGAELPTSDGDFLAFARNLPHPLIADLLECADPLTPIFGSHSGANRRRYPERLARWPDGLLVVGDSLTAFNPIYGHGMSVAARCAAALDEQLSRGDRTRPTQAAIGTVSDDAWILGASRDLGYVNCRARLDDPRLIGPDSQQRLRFSDYITAKAIRSPGVCEVVTGVISLNAPQSELGSTRFLSLLRTDPTRQELTRPPLRPEELAAVDLAG
nr:FAD-dependent oxidoreductase [Micromonospora sp. DSM 115978]